MQKQEIDSIYRLPKSSMIKDRHGDDTTDVRGITQFWKRLTMKQGVPTSIQSYNHLFCPPIEHKSEHVIKSRRLTIYLKSPHVIGGGYMEGSIVLTPLPNMEVTSLELNLYGIEIVFDPIHYSPSTHANPFLNLPIVTLQRQDKAISIADNDTLPSSTDNTREPTKASIPFQFQLPPELGSSYTDKKGCVQYTLQCCSRVRIDDRDEMWHTDRHLQVYQNVLSLKSVEQMSLYHPVCERKRIWERYPVLLSPLTLQQHQQQDKTKQTSSYVELTMSLSRSIWTSGTCLYVSMAMENNSIHKLRDIKLDLIKRQNTFSQTGLEKSFDLMPVTSTCELLASTSLLALGWWQPLDSQSRDQVLIPLEIPPYEFTIKNQKLIDVSFALRISVSSLTSTDAIIEIPITLVHPISADPPPGSLTVTTPATPSSMVPYDPSFHLFRKHHKSKTNSTLKVTESLPGFSSSSSSSTTSSSITSTPSLWSSGTLSYSPFIPITDTPSPPPPPLPPKEEHLLQKIMVHHSSPSTVQKTKTASKNESCKKITQQPITASISETSIPPSHAYSIKSSFPYTPSRSKKSRGRLIIGSKVHPVACKQSVDHKKKLTIADTCEALVVHTADKCKSALFSSTWSPATFSMKKKSIIQKLSSSFSTKSTTSLSPSVPSFTKPRRKQLQCNTSCSDKQSSYQGTLTSPSSTLLTVAPSQKFEISVDELNRLSPQIFSPYQHQYPCRRRYQGFHRFLIPRKNKNR